MFVAYSALFAGIASFSHGTLALNLSCCLNFFHALPFHIPAYYRCGPGNGREADYDNACTIIGVTNTSYNPDRAIEDIVIYERNGLIDNTANLRDKKLYVYAGSRSEVFTLGKMQN